jgi:hypothetical protein
VVRTAFQSKAAQVFYYRDRKRIVDKHIGTGKKWEEINELELVAQDFIDNYSPIFSIFGETKLNNLLCISLIIKSSTN